VQQHPASDPVARTLVRWVALVVARPWLSLACVLASLVAASVYASATLRINSDNTKLVRQDAPFRQHYKAFLERFPEQEDTTLVVVKSDSLDLAEDAVERLHAALVARPDVVATLFAPGLGPFYEDHALLFLEVDALDDAITRLAEAQPALATLVRDPSLRGLFGELEQSLEHLEVPGELPAGFERLAPRIAEIADSVRNGQDDAFRWADEFLGNGEPVYRVISLQGRVDFGETVSSRTLVDTIRQAAVDVGITPGSGVELRLTGMVPLAHDELISMRDGVALAGGVSLVLLGLILGLGVRSLAVVLATFASLGASLVWTTAYAMATVGEFNTISAAFAVLLIGLGVDFGVHLGLRYEEALGSGEAVEPALLDAVRGVGSAIALCALTSALGFLAFIPTEYRGLASLGIIAGGGMFLALVAAVTVLPAVLAVMAAPRPALRTGRTSLRLYGWLSRRATRVVALTAVLAIAAVVVATQMRFDFSTLGMRDPSSESMVTLDELLEEGLATDYSLTALARDVASSERLARQLEALPEVRDVEAPEDFLPSEQEEKLEMLSDAAFVLDPVFDGGRERDAPSRAEQLAAVHQLRARIDALVAETPDTAGLDPARRLAEALDALLALPDPAGALAALERLVLSDLPERIEWLRRAVRVGPVGLDDLPDPVLRRIVSADGVAQVVALPTEDLNEPEALSRFVDAVTAIAPAATGRPAVEAGIGTIVVGSFQLAIVIAFLGVWVLLGFTLRSALDALFVLMPITLAAVMTVALGVVTSTPFNMANVVAIPLVLGLGIDNGIHIFMRFRHDGSLQHVMGSSTPRAVMLSALTTLAAFASLSLSGHRGIQSMGVLLAIAIGCLIYCTLVVLPAMILVRERLSRGAGPRA
jgi:hopanoid biosynthesis associated RND transporter like protein HpnN